MSELRQLLLDTAVRLFEAASEDEVFEAVEEGRFPESHWLALEDNGLADMLLPEEAGGAGVDFGDAMAVARTAGGLALPLPLVETMIGRWLLSGAGLRAPSGPLGLVTSAGASDVLWPDEIAAVVIAEEQGAVGWVAAGEIDKARASEACYEVTRIAHQLHGAIGYTREHDLHRFTRRLWAWRDADGDERYWRQRVGQMTIRSGGAGLWPLLVGA